MVTTDAPVRRIARFFTTQDAAKRADAQRTFGPPKMPLEIFGDEGPKNPHQSGLCRKALAGSGHNSPELRAKFEFGPKI